MLLPELELRDAFERKIIDKSISYLSLVHIARDFNVPLEALLLRLANLGLFDKEKIQEYLDKKTIKDFDKIYRHSYWAETTKPHLSTRYISLTINAFLSGKITKETLAEYVEEDYSAIPSFLRKYGFDENEDYYISYRST